MMIVIRRLIVLAVLAAASAGCVVDSADYGLSWGRFNCELAGDTVTCTPL